MKLLSIGVLFATVSISFAQEVENRPLTISYSKTTSLIFPFSITSVDRGSQDVLAQKARGVENVLQLKAARKSFPETNLTVITADGILHLFTVSYADAPTSQAITIAKSEDKSAVVLAANVPNEREIQFRSKTVLDHSISGHVAIQKKYQMSLCLQDIFVSGETLYYRVRIRNKSAISYDIKSLKFLIRDSKKAKRTSSQEIEVVPMYIGNEVRKIQGFEASTIIYAIRKFTIPDGKTLHINLFEDGGGRHLKLKVHNKDILNAKSLPDATQFLTIN